MPEKHLSQIGRDEHAVIGGVSGKKVFVVDNTGNIITDFGGEKNRTVAIEYVSDKPIYVGEAEMGTAKATAGWRIKKLTYSGDNVSDVQWANGNDGFSNKWTDRGTITYS